MQKTAIRPTDEDSGNNIDRESKANTAEQFLPDARDLASVIATRTREIEQQRRVPWDIIDPLRSSGLFKMLVPCSHGGLGLGVPEILPVITALSAADGSVGWIAMVAASSQLLCSRLPRTIYDELFKNGADPMVIGVGTPAGMAEKIAGGYRVSGRWPLRAVARTRNGSSVIAWSSMTANPSWRVTLRSPGLSFCPRIDGASSKPGMRPGSRAPAVIISRSIRSRYRTRKPATY